MTPSRNQLFEYHMPQTVYPEIYCAGLSNNLWENSLPVYCKNESHFRVLHSSLRLTLVWAASDVSERFSRWMNLQVFQYEPEFTPILIHCSWLDRLEMFSRRLSWSSCAIATSRSPSSRRHWTGGRAPRLLQILDVVGPGVSIIFKIGVFYKAWFEGIEFFIVWPYAVFHKTQVVFYKSEHFMYLWSKNSVFAKCDLQSSKILK